MLKLEIIGNLGADAQIRYANGNKFVAMRVCHSQKINNVETSTWVSVAWSGDGGGLLPYLKKGTKIFARGNLQVRVYRSQAGDWQAGLNMSAHEIELAGSRQDATTEQSQASQPPQNTNAQSSQPAAEKPLGEQVNDEDMPW